MAESFDFTNRNGPLSIGIDALDRELDGGVPAGSVIVYSAPPASQSELLIYELTATRPTLYLSTDRTEDAVADAFARANCPTGDPDIRYVSNEAPLENAWRMSRELGEGQNLVIDPCDALERADRSRYQNFLNELHNHVQNTGSLAILHCMTGTDSELRPVTEHMADVIFDLNQEIKGTDMETRLAVPKFRGGFALSETIKLELSDRVRVDTSRDIA